MCRILKVHRSGYYAWLKHPHSARAMANAHLLWLIRQSHKDSGQTYGSVRVHKDLREWGESCSLNRVARLMRVSGIKGQQGYRKPRFKSGKPHNVVPNRLEQCFSVDKPDLVWVTDITYLRTYEGFVYLAVVIDLYHRMVVGWSMKPSLARGLVLDALLMAVWRRRPKAEVIVHSDQGSQYGSDDWMRFCREHGLIPSMSRRGNCYDNAVAESFFSSLKKERIKKRIYSTRAEARADIFDYIEVFYNRKRRHSYLDNVSPYEFEQAACGNL
jgi:putative transposase